MLELFDAASDPKWKLAGEPIDPGIVDVHVHRVGDRHVMSLLDPQSGVGIERDDVDRRRRRLSRSGIAGPSVGAVTHRPGHRASTRQLYDGRIVVQISEDDGMLKHIVLDHEGNSRVLDPRGSGGRVWALTSAVNTSRSALMRTKCACYAVAGCAAPRSTRTP